MATDAAGANLDSRDDRLARNKPSDRPIRALDPLVVNQIAAGEVVERPASVVKELIDNALDAGASRIVVELERGGVELVRVTDDGVGIPDDELGLAVQPHATSKITATTDLDAIATMGFRGEAVASIASVARLEIRSRRRGAAHAALLSVAGGEAEPVKPASGPIGTRVTVRNLFFNTPARRKFLKTDQTERGHCLDMVRNMAMAHPAVGFECLSDGRTLLDVPPDQSPRERVLAVLGGELAEQLIDCHADRFDDARGLALWGCLGSPDLARPTTKRQHVFLNGRPIRDKTIQHALREAYRGLVDPGKHPLAVLMIEMSPHGVDVNVHPAKAEVRFRDQSLVHRVVYRAAREALLSQDLTPRTGPTGGWRFELQPTPNGSGGGDAPRLGFPSPAGFGAAASSPAPAQALGFGAAAASATGAEASQHPADADASVSTHGGRHTDQPAEFDPFPPLDDADLDEATRSRIAADLDRLRHIFSGERQRLDAERARLAAERDLIERARAELEAKGLSTEHLRPSRVRDAEGQNALPAASPADSILRVHNSFLITQDERGLVIIDQHALHERVMFEKLKKRLSERGSLESQRLLVPAIIETTTRRLAALDEFADLFASLGIDASPMGETSVAVHAFPTFLAERGIAADAFLGELLERADDEGFTPDSEEALHEVLDMMACKAAVKAGDKLSPSEVEELLKLRAETDRAGSCPHGRPTQIRLTLEELERQFGR